ncbi:MAG: hypothetical protein Q9191_007267, partial [Dirinaria sp. TL-2023a]
MLLPERLEAQGREAPSKAYSAQSGPITTFSSPNWAKISRLEALHLPGFHDPISYPSLVGSELSSEFFSSSWLEDSYIGGDSGYQSYNSLPEVPPDVVDLNQESKAEPKEVSPRPGLSKNAKPRKLAHQSERPEKCPIESCEWSRKGFARKHDRNRHILTHFEGKLVCIFCSDAGSASQKNFNRMAAFKRHLVSVHGAEQMPRNCRKKKTTAPRNSLSTTVVAEGGKCSSCFETFHNAQAFYEHVESCVLLHVVHEQGSKQTADQQQSPESTRASKGKKNIQQSASTKDKAVFEDSSVGQLGGAKKDDMDSGDWNQSTPEDSLTVSHTRSLSETQTPTRGPSKLTHSDHVKFAENTMPISDKIFEPAHAQNSSISSMHSECLLKVTAGLEEASTRDGDRTPNTTSGSESDESQNSLIHNSLEIAVLHSRHQIMTRIMEEVYAIFDRRWAPSTQTHAREASESGPQSSPNTQEAGDTGSSRGVKRSRDDRDASPSNGRRRRGVDGELADFEAYNRTELPRLVEANLQTLVNAEILPLEESLKRMLVDIVRRCQSTVAQNYDRIHPASSQERDSGSSQVLNTSFDFQAEDTNVNFDALTAGRQQLLEQPAQLDQTNTTAFFEEPPPQSTNTLDVQPEDYHPKSAAQSPDSGYGSFLFCTCTCPSQEEFPISIFQTP